MPKMKTHRAGAKRYKVSANGKIMRRQAGKSHLLQHKSSKRKRRLGKMVKTFKGNTRLILHELPYKKYSRK